MARKYVEVIEEDLPEDHHVTMVQDYSEHNRWETATKQARNHPNFKAGIERRRNFLRLLENGRTITGACGDMKMSVATYRMWRQRFPEFATHVDYIRGRLKTDHTVFEGNFASFRRVYLGFETYKHQQAIVNAIEQSPAQSVTMVLVPPEHGKTTVIEDWITFKICVNPNVRITVVSEGQPHARKILRRVKSRLMDTKSRLYADFGPFYRDGQEREGKPWQTDFFTVCKADHDERDFTVEARGWRSAVAGTRTDFLIIDDVTSLRNHNQAETVVNTLRQDFFTRPGKEGRTIIVGTRVEQNDVYERLLNVYDERANSSLVTKDIILPAVDEAGNPLCPEMWPKDALDRKRVIVGESVWWRNYQQKPKAAGDLTFTTAMLDKAKNRFAVYGERLRDGHQITGLDPALGGGTALVTWSYNEKLMRVIDVQRVTGLTRTEEILALVESAARRHDIEDLVVEVNSFQKGLGNDDRLQDLAARYGFRVTPHTTGHNKLDETLGVGSMATDMNKGVIELVYGDANAKEVMDFLLGELQAWRPHKSGRELRQDTVMAMWFPTMVIKNRQKIFANMKPDGWDRPGLPWAPTGLPQQREIA